MAEPKDEPVAVHLQTAETTSNNRTVVGMDATLKRFLDHQHNLTRTEAVKESWKPLAWCFYMFFICIMFGYDALAGSVVVSIAEFRKNFGYLYEGAYVVDASWQLGFQAGFFVGMIIGGMLTGIAVQRFGPKYTVLGVYMINIAGVFLQYFATTPAHFFGSKILTGAPLGAFSTIAPTYASEMAPLVVRGAITAGMNFAIVLGNLLGYGVMREAGTYSGKATYRILSPFWLIAQGKEKEARENITKLHAADYDVDGRYAEVTSALAQQAESQRNQGTIKDCFSSDNWRRTMVAMSMFFIQNACGTGWVVGYMSYFMQLAGMPAEQSFNATVGIGGVMLVGNISGWFLIEWLGRRGTALYGALVLCVSLFIIGILSVVKSSHALVVQVVFMGVWAFVYQGTTGAVAWPISSENELFAASRMQEQIVVSI
ncbi:general substrate transporter [Dactylonectria macrodidyma]|uniref:General substrate transporter n=1 Tax=Dactylonectria macrodidyma TaxID=307937 RepID=A0A9P9JP49_9HYPO|nr:general substrate transporter [Dactylonectria macrodidyma]